jgi:hypothetical protein
VKSTGVPGLSTVPAGTAWLSTRAGGFTVVVVVGGTVGVVDAGGDVVEVVDVVVVVAAPAEKQAQASPALRNA